MANNISKLPPIPTIPPQNIKSVKVKIKAKVPKMSGKGMTSR